MQQAPTRDRTAGLESTHQCPICLKRYKRREHLQRHRSSHSSDRSHRCPSCTGSFHRADVLKRHRRTCVGENLPRYSRYSARRRACDRCVRQKKSCNSQRPCHRCSSRAADCCYSGDTVRRERANVSEDGVVKNTNSPIMSLPSLPDPPLEALVPVSNHSPASLDCSSPSWQALLAMMWESPPAADGAHSLHFLDKMTSRTGLVDSFECGTENQRRQVWTKLQRECTVHDPSQALSGLLELPFHILDPPLAQIAEPDGPSLDWLDDPLSLKTHQLLLLIKDIVRVKPRNSAVTLDWSPGLQNACLQFFSPSNLRKFLGLYWAIWHPNVNFVHRASFDPLTAKPAILATMALIGACVSPERSDNEDARLWFNCVEELVFTDEDFNSDMTYLSSTPLNLRSDRVQALQAAYMVCLYQNWEGSDVSKRRIRRHRFATLVSTARDIDLSTVRHVKYSDQAQYEFEWKDFAAREELIRVLLWVFLLDTAFVIFNNGPPRMVIREMANHLSVPDICFNSPTADQCYNQIRTSLPSSSHYWTMSFGNVFKGLCSESLPIDIQYDLALLGPLNLFALTSAIHTQIFQYRNSWGTVQLLPPIQNALRNWKDVWQLSNTFPTVSSLGTADGSDLPLERMWERYGLCKYCPEYWLLANLMITHLNDICSQSGTQENAGQGHSGCLDDGPVDSILNKYDQTSMRQVNDLISAFQNYQIGSPISSGI